VDNNDGTHKILFSPSKSGTYVVEVKLISPNGHSETIKGSPFKVNLSIDESEVTKTGTPYNDNFAEKYVKKYICSGRTCNIGQRSGSGLD